MSFNSFNLRQVVVGLVLSFCLASSSASAETIIFDFSGSGGNMGIGAPPLVKTSGGVTVTVTAWSYITSFQPGSLGQWSNGLGVCNSAELASSCTNGKHQIDNEGGQQDYLLFQFSSSALVDPTRAFIVTTDSSDLDVSYWTGNFVDPGDRLKDDLYATLASRGFGSLISNDGSGTSRWVDLTSGNANALLIGAKTTGTDDSFKLDQLKISTTPTVAPEPASLLLLGSGLVAAGMRRRASKKRIAK